MTPKKWLLVGALVVVVLLIAAAVLYYYTLPAEFMSDEKFRADCGELNECSWLDSGK